MNLTVSKETLQFQKFTAKLRLRTSPTVLKFGGHVDVPTVMFGGDSKRKVANFQNTVLVKGSSKQCF